MGLRTSFVLPLSVIALLAAGCGTPGDEVPQWSGAPAAELQPNDMQLTHATLAMDPTRSIAIDGAGNVWSTGPWQLTRLDPAGRATTWDASDDLALTDAWGLAPSDGSAVWLKGQKTVRLFDGTRFIADLTVPEELLQILDDPEALRVVRDVSEVGGDQVWISIENQTPDNGDGERPPLAGRIVSFSDGKWSTVADFPTRVADRIIVDTDGKPWVLLRNDPSADTPSGTLRWDGSAFVAPASDDPDYPMGGNFIAPAPDGGVFVINYTSSGNTLYGFDGTSWTVVATDVSEHTGEAMAGDALAADSDGAWIASSAGVSHVTPAGEWHDFGADEGIDTSDTVIPTVAARGDKVVARTAAGLQALGSDSFNSLWVDPADTRVTGALLAISTDETWAGFSRYRAGNWTTPLGASPEQGSAGARTSDGAAWFVTPDGVTRILGDTVTVVADDVTSSPIEPGADGSVWVVVDGDAVRLSSDGTKTPIGHPDEGEVSCLLAGGTDGSLWVDVGCESSPAPLLYRWDGAAWEGISLPGPDVWLSGMIVTDDNTAWGAFVGQDPQDRASGLARYVDGKWQTYPGWPFGVIAAPGGVACSMDDPDSADLLRCYDATGLTSTYQLPQMTTDVSIANDGTIWINGAVVARFGTLLSDT